MKSVRNGTRGLVFLVNLNRDLILSLASVGLALAAAALVARALQTY